ncbi:hypothetical protein SO802_010806 [Lithocarpus litseifolius]|uniref:Uncharacterized protein n=1 Tax=Lithocarpus litseifolius TaxID=425828 RepID=A0AAW2DGP7_9ROSI
MDRRSLKLNYKESLAMSLLEILCSSCSSCSSCSWCVLRVLGAFLRLQRALLICGLLRFLEAFELDSSELEDLGRWLLPSQMSSSSLMP